MRAEFKNYCRETTTGQCCVKKMPTQQRQAFFSQMAATLPSRRVGTAEDIADAIAFVVGNGFVTGSVVECDGGARLI